MVLIESGKYKKVFTSGDELVPTPEGGWKLVDNQNEVDLPEGSKWKIVFTDGSKIFPVPYKSITEGQWVLLMGSGLLTGEIMVHDGGSLFVPGGFFEMKPKHVKNRKKAFDALPKLRKAYKIDDDDDDEDKTMRSFDSGDGDNYGF
ncbi:hypothetical protein AUC43_15250 [Hymenobacter sedentarius]|uniref:Uncharacterized protein n=2 Tax=Hymenobacter sedentarius TaxID=1411621 RepID=A0A0U3K174_9BACT|nr:hypothetical protein AUC43_15250 [Hymenobacter sedentarius]